MKLMQNSILRSTSTLLTTLAVTALFATSAGAITRSMTGAAFVENPSAGMEAQPRVAPNASVEVAGAGTGTSVGRSVSLGAGVFDLSGIEVRSFPAFANVGGVTKSFMSFQDPATFMNNNGALANCPGDGCNTAGTAISWCPPAGTPIVNTNAPGTSLAKVGNWDCTNWQTPGSGIRGVRLAVSNASARPNFGGTFSLLRNFAMNVWRVDTQPSTPSASDARVSRSFMNVVNQQWTPGMTNFRYTTQAGNKGPKILASLNAAGGVAGTFGCVNASGTVGVGATFVKGVPQAVPGSNCGTEATNNPPGQGFGFKMTTGTLSGSDLYPFGLVVNTVAGTVFNPSFGTQPASQGFFFSRMGTDQLIGSDRNLVLLGGGVAYDPGSYNAFFRISRVRMNMNVPEPALGFGIVAGIGALAMLARRRQI